MTISSSPSSRVPWGRPATSRMTSDQMSGVSSLHHRGDPAVRHGGPEAGDVVRPAQVARVGAVEEFGELGPALAETVDRVRQESGGVADAEAELHLVLGKMLRSQAAFAARA